jgi:ABC-type sugar transport system substrate-binding protein
MKKRFLLLGFSLLLLLAVTLVLTGPVLAENKPGEGLQFTFIDHGDPADPFHAKIVSGWKEAAAALGVKATELFAYGDHAKTIDYVNAAIAAKVDGILVFSVDPEGLHPSVQLAVEKGIDIVLMSSRDPVFGPEEVPFVGFDIEEQGYTLGKYIAKQLKAANLVSDVNIAFFAEFLAPYSVQRRQGFLRALKDAGITYIASDIYEVGVDLGVVVDKTKAYLLAHPDTAVLIGLGSLTTPAGGMVLQELGYEPGKVKWAGFDLMPETVAAIKAGYGASNVDEVFNYGFYACMTLYLRAKYDFIVGDLPIATVMVDKSNIEEYTHWVELGIK